LAGSVRDLSLFNLAIDSKLRACDLVAISVADVAISGRVRERATTLVQRDLTGKISPKLPLTTRGGSATTYCEVDCGLKENPSGLQVRIGQRVQGP
jgi:hypothetical protein